MHLLATIRGFGVVLLGGTLVGYVPQIESPFAISSLSVQPSSSEGDDASAAAAEAAVSGLDVRGKHLQLIPQISIQPLLRADWASADGGEPSTVRLAASEEVVKKTSPKSKDLVKAKVFLSVDKLPAGDKCKFAVVLDVHDGWHINANPPSPDTMIATMVTVQSKLKSKLLETKYPKGSDLTIEELPEPVSVYEGEVLIRGEIQAAGDAAGKTEELEFQVKYQACNEKTCLPPKTLKLAGKIPVVKPGTPIKQINQKYFSEKK